MVERKICSFCGAELEPDGQDLRKEGRHSTYVRSDECFVNMVKLGRVPRKTMWTRSAVKEKATRMGKTASAEGATNHPLLLRRRRRPAERLKVRRRLSPRLKQD